MHKHLSQRLSRIEANLPSTEPDAPVFITTISGRRRTDDGQPVPPGEFSDATVTGAYAEPGRLVARLPGERIEALKRRTAAALPDRCVFLFAYGQGAPAGSGFAGAAGGVR